MRFHIARSCMPHRHACVPKSSCIYAIMLCAFCINTHLTVYARICWYACVLLCTLVVCACMNDTREAECVSFIYCNLNLYTKWMSLCLYSWYNRILLTFLTANRDIFSASYLHFLLPCAFYVIFSSHTENSRRLCERDICISKLSGGKIHMEKEYLTLSTSYSPRFFHIFIYVLWFCFAAFPMKSFCNSLYGNFFKTRFVFVNLIHIKDFMTLPSHTLTELILTHILRV